MFNFKSLFLTAITTLGLAVNVQACKYCREAVYGHNGQMREAIDYARKNADALVQELEQVFFNAQATKKAQEKLVNLGEAVCGLEILIMKSTHTTAKEFFTAPETREALDNVTNKLCDVDSFAEALFPATTVSHLNIFAHKVADAVTQDLRKSCNKLFYPNNRTSKDLALPAETKAKLVKFIETHMMPPFVRLISAIFDFPIKNKELCLAYCKALCNVLKDDAFWAELDNDTPNHTFPKTASFTQLQEATQRIITAPTEILRCAQDVTQTIAAESRLRYPALPQP